MLIAWICADEMKALKKDFGSFVSSYTDTKMMDGKWAAFVAFLIVFDIKFIALQQLSLLN